MTGGAPSVQREVFIYRTIPWYIRTFAGLYSLFFVPCSPPAK